MNDFDFSEKKEVIKVKTIIISEYEMVFDKVGNLLSSKFLRSFPGRKQQIEKKEEQQKLDIKEDEEIII